MKKKQYLCSNLITPLATHIPLLHNEYASPRGHFYITNKIIVGK